MNEEVKILPTRKEIALQALEQRKQYQLAKIELEKAKLEFRKENKNKKENKLQDVTDYIDEHKHEFRLIDFQHKCETYARKCWYKKYSIDKINKVKELLKGEAEKLQKHTEEPLSNIIEEAFHPKFEPPELALQLHVLYTHKRNNGSTTPAGTKYNFKLELQLTAGKLNLPEEFLIYQLELNKVQLEKSYLIRGP